MFGSLAFWFLKSPRAPCCCFFMGHQSLCPAVLEKSVAQQDRMAQGQDRARWDTGQFGQDVKHGTVNFDFNHMAL